MAKVMAIKYTHRELAGILTTALEGGIGYWAMSGKIVRCEGYGNVMSVVLHPAEDSTDFLPMRVEPWMLQPAIDKIASGEYDNLLATIIAAVRSGDIANMDAEVCDCIVQIALFGMLVYG